MISAADAGPAPETRPAIRPAMRPAMEIVGHGGAGAYHHPNSRPSMEAALALGVDRIECDVHRAADGTLVLTHDAAIRLPDGGHLSVGGSSVPDLRSLLPGFLTLDDLVEMTTGRVPLLLDVKRAGYETEIVDAIRRHRLVDAAAVSTTHLSTLRRLRGAFPTMRLALSSGHWAGHDPPAAGRVVARAALRRLLPWPLLAALRLVDATEATLHHRVATAPLVAALHARRYRVGLWTVDDPAAIHRAIALGVDAITSNRPDLVRALVTARASGRP